MKKLAVIGSNGMLGREFCLSEISKYYSLAQYDLPLFDICNKEEIEKIISSNDIILNCAAYTAVDKAESEVDKCYLINFKAVKYLSELVKKYNKYLVQISTDFVFGDSSNEELNEKSATNPLSVYGKSKLDGEESISKSGAKAAILRIQWTYGKYGDNFISKIINLSKKTNVINVVSDQIGTPTSTIEVSKAITDLINLEATGIYHFASVGYASRFEVAQKILAVLGIQTRVQKCLTKEFVTPAKRPLNSRFNCSKIDEILSFKRDQWQKGIEQFIVENFS